MADELKDGIRIFPVGFFPCASDAETMESRMMPNFNRLVRCLFIVTWLWILGAWAVAAPRHVVFILADDLGWGELGCYGQQKIKTPHIDQLAREGMRFTQHYSGAPVCAPSRCVLLSGKHTGHADIRGNRQASRSLPQCKEGQHPIEAHTWLLSQSFKESGYATAAMGKWGLGPVGTSGDPNRHGFDLFYGYNCQAVAHSFYPKFLWRNDQQVLLNEIPVPGHDSLVKGEVKAEKWIGKNYSSLSILREALQFIDEHQKEKFFLFLPFIEPHMAMHPPLSSVDQYPKEWDDQPYRGQSGYLPHPRPRAAYAAMISDLDRHVGQVVEKLRQAGILDETLIVFTSDNGTTHMAKDPQFGIGGVDAAFFQSTRDLKAFKGSVYEGGLRVPMIVRYPSAVKAGIESETPSYFADWFPTLIEACSLKPRDGLDGDSLWPVMTGQATVENRKPMIWAYPEYTGQVAVRMGNHKVLRRGLHTKKPGDWEVYDVTKDRGETKNLAQEKPDLIREAEKILIKEISDNPVFPLRFP
jgi:arylsulfatase A-like enzyme